MTNEQKAKEICGQGVCDFDCIHCGNKLELSGLKAMAKYKDSQPKIIEIFGKRVKIVSGDGSSNDCMKCALIGFCMNSSRNICQTADEKFNRHFVEVDEDGNEIK